MPRPYTLSDVVDTLNTEIGTALSPDVSAVDTELNNQFATGQETPIGSDGSTGTPSTFTGTPLVTRTASGQNWDADLWGRFQWA